MNKLNPAFIINPISGGKRKDRVRKAVIAKISSIFPEAPVEFTSPDGGASILTRKLIEKGYNCIGVMGGDGTWGSAVSGFFADDKATPINKEVCLGIIPAGTGGDFPKTLGIEDDPIAALGLFTGTASRKCDVGIVRFTDEKGTISYRYFLNIVSFGLSGLVDRFVASSSKRLGGKAAFFIATLKGFAKYKNVNIKVEFDGRETKELTSVLVAAANGRFFGGGMHIAPKARIDDGLLEIVLVGDLKMSEFILNCPKLYRGEILDDPRIYYRPAKRIKITPHSALDTMLMDIDGEPIGKIPAEVEIIPEAIKLKI